jgi:hypothetical protein
LVNVGEKTATLTVKSNLICNICGNYNYVVLYVDGGFLDVVFIEFNDQAVSTPDGKLEIE